MAQDAFPPQDHTLALIPPPARAQQGGLVALKAVQRICYSPNQLVRGSVMRDGARMVDPGAMFMPVSAVERAELLAGQYPAAVQPTAVELAAFG